jgi:hypothetical protein
LGQNALDVPECPTEEWCEARGGSSHFVFIPVFCKACNVWTFHAYSNFGGDAYYKWKTFRFWQFGDSSSVDFRFVASYHSEKPFCGIIEMVVRFGWRLRKSIHFRFPITEFSNTPCFSFKAALLKSFLYNSTLVEGSSRRFAKLCQFSQDEALQNFFPQLAGYESKAELLKRNAIATVFDLHRLKDSIQAPSLQLTREVLQRAVLDYDPESRKIFLDAGIPLPESGQSQTGEIRGTNVPG